MVKKAEPYDGEIVPDLSEFDTNFSVNAKIEAEKAVKNFGDHQKDLRYEWDGVLTDLHCALIPTYQIEVESHGKPYCATVLGAFVKVCGWNNKRSPGRSGSANYQAEVDAIRKKRGQGFKRIKNTSSLMAIVGLLIVLFVILEAYSGCFASFWFLLIPGVASAAIGGYLTYYCKKNVNATKDGFKGDDFAERYQDAIRNVKSVFFNQASEAAGLSARKTVDDALPKSIEELEKWKNGVRASTSKQKEKKPDTKEKKPEAGDVEIAPVAVAPIVNEPAAAPAVAEEEAPKDEAPVEAAPATDEPAVSPAVVEEEPKIVEEAPTPDEVPVAVAPIVNEPAAAPAVAEEEAPKDEAPMADEAPVTAAPAEEPAPRKEKPVEPSVAPTPVEKAPKAEEDKPKGEKKEEPAKGEPSQKRKSKKKKIIIGSVIAAALAVVTPAGFAIKQLTVPFAAWEIKYKAISPHEVVAVGLAEETTSLGFPSEFSHASTRFTVVKIEDRAFAGCNSLNFVDTGHVPEIGQNAFSDCKNLKRVTVGSKKVGAMAFAFCHSLSNVELYADTIEEIGRDAFAGIASDNISVQYIGASGQGGGSCFYLNYLRSFFNDPKIAIEHGCRFVNEIQGDAIRAIYVPETVKHISPMAFENCPFLTDIVYQGSPTAWSRIGAEDINLGIKLENINFHYDVSQAEWDAMVF